jgi:hypothetical protein
MVRCAVFLFYSLACEKTLNQRAQIHASIALQGQMCCSLHPLSCTGHARCTVSLAGVP